MPAIEMKIEDLRKNKIFVATPMYGGQCFGTYAKSCLDLASAAVRYGIDVRFYYLFNESLITRARNYLVDEFLRSDCTHLMFIDSDIEFNPLDVFTLAYLDKDIACGPYPKKCIAWEKIIKAVEQGRHQPDMNNLANYVGDYVFNPIPGTLSIRLDEPVEVLEGGTGFMMIRRDVFEKFRDAYPDLEFRPDHNRSEHFNGTRMIHAYFDTVIDPKTRRYLSEDYMFCQWAREVGVKVWLCPWMELKHSGTYVFGGSLGRIAELGQVDAPGGVPSVVAEPPAPLSRQQRRALERQAAKHLPNQ